jgi:antitoxin ParD1/3/4
MAKRPRMNVSLTPRLSRFVDERVRSGMYESPSEVVRESLRLLEQREQERQADLAHVKSAVAAGLRAADSGDLVDGPEALKKLRRQVRGSRRSRG